MEFRRTIETLYAEGVRIFVEAGPRGNLSAFLEDILRGKQCSIVPANVQRRTGITQLNHLVAILAVQGVDLDLAYLYARREPRRVNWLEGADALAPAVRDARIPLLTGWPMLRLPDAVVGELRHGATADANPDRDDRPYVADAASHRSLETAWSEPDAPQLPAAAQPSPHLPLPDYANGSYSPAANGQVAPLPQPVQATGDDEAAAAAVMQSYLQTMEQFVAVQEQVMRAFLTRDAGVALPPVPAVSVQAPVSVQPAPRPRDEAPPVAAAPPIGMVARPFGMSRSF